MWPILTQLFNVEEDEDEEGSSVDGENVREIMAKKDVEGIVTKIQDFYGLIDDYILFNINICSGLNLPVVGDRVRAKICKGRTSEYWRAMSVVKCTNFWEDYNEWGSNIYDSEIDEDAKNQLARQERRKAEMQYLEKLLKDKFGVEIAGEDFGCLEVSSKKSLTVELKNLGLETQTLTGYHMVGLSQQMELGPLKINSISLKEQSKKIQEALPLIMHPGMVVELNVICSAKHIGKESQMIVFDFSEFKIGKELTVDVTHPCLVEEEREQFLNRKSDALDRIKRTRQEVKNRDLVVVPGPKFANFGGGKKYYRAKLFHYNVPEELKDCILEGEEITKVVPCLRRPLDASNYEVRFKALLHIEEVQQEIEMRNFDIAEAEFEMDGMFLNLQVPGLMEGRPSLILGDRLIVSKNENLLSGKVSYMGSVHQIRNDIVSLKFSPEFHANFDPIQKYSVSFQMNRGTLRRCHRAIELVAKFKGEVLFPQRVTLKPPLVDLILPGQGSSHTNSSNPRKGAGRMAKFFNQSLNRQQQLAVARILGGVVRPLPYVIFGPPGTGKTITIVEAILQLLASRSRVRILACTPSNSAADLLTERLYETGQVSKSDMVRLCAALRMEEAIPLSVRPFCANVEDVDLVLEDKTVVICTCSTAGSLYEGTQTRQIVLFTHVFVDEAGQATEPECMVAVALAKVSSAQVILAGDPQQLGPVLRSSLAKEHGLDMSYLERLCSLPLYRRDLEKFAEHGGYDPLLITKLVDNYRCHPAIIGLSSCMFYNDELKVKGNLDLINCLSSWDDLPNRNNFPILFHGVRGEDLREGNSPSWFNPHEVVLTIKYLKSLLMYEKYAVSPDDIGIITPYRKQVEKIRLMANSFELPKVKVGSVEEFQGQERLAIIISTVRSSESQIELDWKCSLGFLGNSKRFNVSITRAHSLLVVIGNPYILCQDVYWSSLIKYCIENGAYIGCNPPMFAADGCPLFENPLESSAELEETSSETLRDLESEAIKREKEGEEQKEISEAVEDDTDVIASFRDDQVINRAPDFEAAACDPSPLGFSSNNNVANLLSQTTASGDRDGVSSPPPPADGEVYDIPLSSSPASGILPSSLSETFNVTSAAVNESNEKVAKKEGVGVEEGPMDDELMWKITRQIEYYFGEVNLRKDGFLLQRISESPDGWVDIDVMMTFNKVKELQVGASDIVEALRRHSSVVEVSTDELRLRRDPLKPIEPDLEKWKEDMYQRSIVMRNYPSSETMERMQSFFAFYGPIVHIERNVLLKVWSNSKFYKMEKCDLILFDNHYSAKNLSKHKYTRLQKMGLELFFLDELVKQCLVFFVARRIENVSRPEAPSIRRGGNGFRGNQQVSRGRGYKPSQPRNFQNSSRYGSSGQSGFSSHESSSAWGSNFSREFRDENRQSSAIIDSDESDEDVVVLNSHTDFKG